MTLRIAASQRVAGLEANGGTSMGLGLGSRQTGTANIAAFHWASHCLRHQAPSRSYISDCPHVPLSATLPSNGNGIRRQMPRHCPCARCRPCSRAPCVSSITMRNWTERTGVYDDICYLRQAHLFQRFGLGGIDTYLSRDNDGYFANLAREIGFADWNIPARLPCLRQSGKS